MRSTFSYFEAKWLRPILIVSWTEKKTNKMNAETSNLSQGIVDQSKFLQCDLSCSAKNSFRNSWIWSVFGTSTNTEWFVSSTAAQQGRSQDFWVGVERRGAEGAQGVGCGPPWEGTSEGAVSPPLKYFDYLTLKCCILVRIWGILTHPF